MKYYFLFIVFIVFSSNLFSQKKLFRTYDASDTHTLAIASDYIFQIKLTTAQTDQITIYTEIEGETYESALLHTEVVNSVLKITTGHTPDFVPFNDKLSAHKILSIVLEVILPEGFTVNVSSTLASVEIQGNYDQIHAHLERGSCDLSSFCFRESVYINTVSGNIMLETRNAKVLAQSRNGKVVIPKGMNGVKIVDLQTIYGDITVVESQ